MKSIDEIMRGDHERLDALLAASAQAIEGLRWEEGATLLAQFQHDIIENHIAVEESMLFPAFEAQEGGDANHPLTSLLRKGHKDLRVFFEEMAEAISARDTEEFEGLLSTVQAILKTHDAKEETELYPFLSKAFPENGEAFTQAMAALKRK